MLVNIRGSFRLENLRAERLIRNQRPGARRRSPKNLFLLLRELL
jgi:hypothetical protein